MPSNPSTRASSTSTDLGASKALTSTVGTALGGGAGAALSSKDDPRPILAGLAVGPLLGIATGAVLAPRLRSSSSLGDSHAMWIPSRKVAGFSAHLVSAATWSPMVGALPQDPGTPESAPFLMGVTGTLKPVTCATTKRLTDGARRY